MIQTLSYEDIIGNDSFNCCSRCVVPKPPYAKCVATKTKVTSVEEMGFLTSAKTRPRFDVESTLFVNG